MKNSIIKFSLLIGAWTLPFVGFASSETGAEAEPLFYPSLGNYLFLFGTVLVILSALFVIYNTLKLVVKMRELEIYEKHGLEDYLAAQRAKEGSWWKQFSRAIVDVVPLEEEKNILMDHNYDGIRELDNNLPPWWLYGFYLSIVIAVVYMGIYHFSSYAKSSAELYEIEMAEAKIQVESYLAQQADAIDESTIEPLTDELSLAQGRDIFNANCVACHLESGGGGPGSVGPNLTDEYWIHGGGIKNIFKTVKYGVPEKGMISWKTQLRPADMHKVSSYILALQGSNPPNAKEPQGELYKEEVE
jgi:cytochrome c oxidase cbb3-type subunit 3